MVARFPALAMTKTDRRMDPALCGNLLKLGLPIALQNLVISGGGIAVQRVVNGFGFLFIAAYTVTNKLYGLLERAATSVGHALSVYTGQNMGAGRLNRISFGQRTGTWISLGVSLLIGLVMLLTGRRIFSLFISADQESFAVALGYGYDCLRLMRLFFPSLYLLYVYRSVLQGMGNAPVPLASGMVELLMRLASAFWLTGPLKEYGIYMAEISAWVGAAVLLATVYYFVMRRLRQQAEV
jgi:Na+-driven multidrug efflux pump